MRYAIFTDIHANLEALEAVLAKIDEIAKDEPVDQIWFLGDLVGYGPDPNECIRVLRERTDVIIAGNHDWAAVGKIDLEDFSAAARVSAEWTAEQLTQEHRDFLADLPERLEIGDCTLVHGSPFGPLWEYLTTEALAERSFLYFDTRYCLVGHTHVPVIFIQPDAANIPTLPLTDSIPATNPPNGTNPQDNGMGNHHEPLGDGEHSSSAVDDTQAVETTEEADDDETVELVVAQGQQSSLSAEAYMETATHAHQEPHGSASPPADDAGSGAASDDEETDPAFPLEPGQIPQDQEDQQSQEQHASPAGDDDDDDDSTAIVILDHPSIGNDADEAAGEDQASEPGELDDSPGDGDDINAAAAEASDDREEEQGNQDGAADAHSRTPVREIASAEERLTSEIEELLNLLGLSQSMVDVTNEMLTPPEGHWETPPEHRAIINPGGVGQPRDGDPRAAFMIYDTARGFEFYRVSYDFEKTQDKIVKAGLPQFLAVRLAYGR